MTSGPKSLSSPLLIFFTCMCALAGNVDCDSSPGLIPLFISGRPIGLGVAALDKQWGPTWWALISKGSSADGGLWDPPSCHLLPNSSSSLGFCGPSSIPGGQWLLTEKPLHKPANVQSQATCCRWVESGFSKGHIDYDLMPARVGVFGYMLESKPSGIQISPLSCL